MDAVRARFGSILEWVVAAVFLAATILVGSLILRELRAVTSAAPPAAVEMPPLSPPTSVPGSAISVPVLLLLDGKEIRVGDALGEIGALLGPNARVDRQQIDRGALGERLTRFYEHAGTRFILVFEPFERRGEPKVAAIYLH